MRRSMCAFICLLALSVVGCPKTDPTLPQEQVKIIDSLEFNLFQHGYMCEVNIYDLDGNDRLDIQVKVIRPLFQTKDASLEFIAAMIAYCLAEWGRDDDFDKLSVKICFREYRVEFKQVLECGSRAKEKRDRGVSDPDSFGKCLKALWEGPEKA